MLGGLDLGSQHRIEAPIQSSSLRRLKEGWTFEVKHRPRHAAPLFHSCLSSLSIRKNEYVFQGGTGELQIADTPIIWRQLSVGSNPRGLQSACREKGAYGV